jgi:hypothetical protein
MCAIAGAIDTIDSPARSVVRLAERAADAAADRYGTFAELDEGLARIIRSRSAAAATFAD